MRAEQAAQAADAVNSAGPATSSLLRAVDLTRHFRLGGMFSKRVLHAVDDFNLAIREREIVALVGESGSGKSTVARLLARVYSPTRGEIYFRDRSWDLSSPHSTPLTQFDALHPTAPRSTQRANVLAHSCSLQR